MECKKCNKSLFLQSYDGLWVVDIKNKKARLMNLDIEEGSNDVIDEQEVNYCPLCGEKL